MEENLENIDMYKIKIIPPKGNHFGIFSFSFFFEKHRIEVLNWWDTV